MDIDWREVTAFKHNFYRGPKRSERKGLGQTRYYIESEEKRDERKENQIAESHGVRIAAQSSLQDEERKRSHKVQS